MGECAMLGRGSTDLVWTLYGLYRSVRTRSIPKTNCAKIGCDQSMSGRHYALGINMASRRCFVEANNQWELPCV
ncbi:unnamed protein product [Brassica rapa]|uniref:Uncharacterized protein n=1 Tax=Brassica campestris TaxID=3711 RepID=A0A3P5ZVC0_BRACM|nr:unnamed protein product [Brassica rapa]VDC76360.1 unnamed protein product [Brassica rapa]